MEEERLLGLTVREETMGVLMQILSKVKSEPTSTFKVKDLRSLVDYNDEDDMEERKGCMMVCDFTLLSFARCCVELGALAVIQ